MQRFLNALGPITHILAGVLPIAWYAAARDLPNLLPVTLLAMLVALLPDVDTQSSLIGRALPFISIPLERRYGHRQITHSLLALLACAALLFLLFPDAWLLLTAAYASHLILDMLIGHIGIPLFWPHQTRFHFAHIRPASMWEGIIAFILALLIAASALPRSVETVSEALPQPTATATLSPTPTPTPRLMIITVRNVYDIEDEIRVRTGDQVKIGQVVANLATHRRLIATPTPTIATATSTPTSTPTSTATLPIQHPTPDPLYLAELDNNRALAHAYYQRALATATPDPNKIAAAPAYNLAIAEKRDCLNANDPDHWRYQTCLKELQALEATAVSLLITAPPIDPLDANIAYHQWQVAEIRYQQAIASLTPPATISPIPLPTTTPTLAPSPTQTPLATNNFLPATNNQQPSNPDDTHIVAIVSGQVHSIQVVSVSGNTAVVEIAILVPYNPALDPVPPTAPPPAPTAEALSPATIPTIVVSVADGDTATFLINGVEETTRFIGVDTPETVHPEKPVQCYGPEASAFTKEMLPIGSTVYLELGEEERDRYGRLLAYIYLPDGTMLNQQLITEGYGTALTIPPNDRYAPLFTTAEAEAKANERGLWSACK